MTNVICDNNKKAYCIRLNPTPLPQFGSESLKKLRFSTKQFRDPVRLESNPPTKVSSKSRVYSDRGPKLACFCRCFGLPIPAGRLTKNVKMVTGGFPGHTSEIFSRGYNRWLSPLG